MRGDPPSVSVVAMRALEHKARLNGHLIEDAQLNSPGLQIVLHLGEGAGEPKPAINLQRTRTIGPAQ